MELSEIQIDKIDNTIHSKIDEIEEVLNTKLRSLIADISTSDDALLVAQEAFFSG